MDYLVLSNQFSSVAIRPLIAFPFQWRPVSTEILQYKPVYYTHILQESLCMLAVYAPISALVDWPI